MDKDHIDNAQNYRAADPKKIGITPEQIATLTSIKPYTPTDHEYILIATTAEEIRDKKYDVNGELYWDPLNNKFSTEQVTSKYYWSIPLLSHAASLGYVSLFEALMYLGADVKSPTIENTHYLRPMHIAISLQNHKFLQHLLKLNKDYNWHMDEGYKPLDNAHSSGLPQFFGSAIPLAIEKQDKKALKLFHEAGFDLNKNYIVVADGRVVSSLKICVLNSKPIALETILSLISKTNLDIQENKHTLLELAASRKEESCELTSILLKFGANPNILINLAQPNIYSTALFTAFYHEQYDAAVELIKHGAKLFIIDKNASKEGKIIAQPIEKLLQSTPVQKLTSMLTQIKDSYEECVDHMKIYTKIMLAIKLYYCDKISKKTLSDTEAHLNLGQHFSAEEYIQTIEKNQLVNVYNNTLEAHQQVIGDTIHHE